LTPATNISVRRKRPWRQLSIVCGIVILGGFATMIIGAIAFSNASTSLTRKDFASNAKAAEFVSAHLPAPLAGAIAVRTLTYEAFTDWHLDAVIDLGTAQAADDYLESAKKKRHLNPEYCGTTDIGGSVYYFLSKVSACGAISRGRGASELRVECHTR
jgi:hypothetical protein